MSFKYIADRIARIARAATQTGSSSRSDREALREAEELIAREKKREAEARARREAAIEAARPKHDPEVVAALTLFGLKPGVSLLQVTAEYRRRIVETHPDRNGADRSAATERTQQLNAAYALLKRVYKG